jgi:UDP-N-acetylglucosamine/UDP-N-acetylgalactosamine diphosphorylase
MVDGVKFETFVFDALGHAERSISLEVERTLEFSPVKNAEGSDSPVSTRRDMTHMFAGWIEAAGGDPPPTDEAGEALVEVDPRFAEDAESFAARMPARPEVRGSGHLYR